MNVCKSERPKTKDQRPKTKDLSLRTEKGFTLIELSIAIIIIGLIVAGVVGGQSLVYQAKIRSIMSDYKKYDIAVNTFKLEYNALPGDTINANDYWPGCNSGATAAQCNGNGDKIIDLGSLSNSEALRSWQHLVLAQIIPGNYTGVAGTFRHHEIGVNAPRASLPNSGFSLKRCGWYGTVRNCLELGSTIPNQPPHGAAIKGRDAIRIDTKLDDGIMNTGSIFVALGIRSMPPIIYETGCNEQDTVGKCRMNFALSASP